MGSLLIYLKDYKKESVLGPLFKLLEASFELLVPLVMAAIIDKGIANGDRDYIYKMCGVLILLAVVGLTCSITAQYYAAKAAVGFAAKLRHALFTHIQKFSYAEMDNIGSSTMITRMTSDVNQVQSGVNLVLRLFLRSPFIVIGAVVMAFTIDGKAALIFAVAVPLLSIVVFGIMLVSIPLYKRVQLGVDEILGITRENLSGSRVIRAFQKEEEEIKNFGIKNQLLTSLQLYAGKITALMNPLTYVIINLALAALIWSGAIRVNAGHITTGEVVALVNYMSQILVELIKFATLIITVTKAVACGNRVQSILEINTSMADGTADESAEKSEYAVEFRQVSMRYPSAGVDALTGLDLKVKPGETIGIIGGTGSGKSTLVNLIPRFYDVRCGEVIVNGRNVTDYRMSSLRRKIGIVPQRAVLFEGTVRENLKWGNQDAADEELYRALSLAQAEFVGDKEGKLDAAVEQGGRNYSGGQKQRLTIARALVKQPEILIMDDSASALDYATDAKLRMAIRGMEPKPTLFLVSQRASSILHADQIVVLDDGGIAGIGTHEELLDCCEIYQEIYYSQYEKDGRKEAGA